MIYFMKGHGRAMRYGKLVSGCSEFRIALLVAALHSMVNKTKALGLWEK